MCSSARSALFFIKCLFINTKVYVRERWAWGLYGTARGVGKPGHVGWVQCVNAEDGTTRCLH